jgi:protoporphyrinogen oxidase
METFSQSQSYAIIGGGMLGLTLALRLTEAGHKVTIFEGSNEIGGLASAWQLGDVVWDKHYHVTLLSDTAIRSVLDQLGLEKEMQWVETKTGFYTDGKLVSMSNTVEFLKFPPLGLIGKFRLGATIFYASRIKDWKKLEKVSVADWLTKLSGKKTFEKIWLPLLKAKLGENYKLASAAFIWATIARMYAARRTGLKKEMFGYVPGGYARILERFGQVLDEKGVRIELNSRVEKIEVQGGNAIVEMANGKLADNKREKFDNVILTVPSAVAATICPALTGEEKTKLNGVQYQGIVCASVLLKKSLAQYYVTNITDEVPFTAVIEMSALVDKEKHFGGNALVYLPKYVGPDDEAFNLSDEELKENFISTLERMYSHFKRDDVLCFKVSRVRYVFPIPTLSYSDKLPSMKTSVPNVFIINSAHIINGTLNVNETVQLAERAAKMLLNESELLKLETKTEKADSKSQIQRSKLETV